MKRKKKYFRQSLNSAYKWNFVDKIAYDTVCRFYHKQINEYSIFIELPKDKEPHIHVTKNFRPLSKREKEFVIRSLAI